MDRAGGGDGRPPRKNSNHALPRLLDKMSISTLAAALRLPANTLTLNALAEHAAFEIKLSLFFQFLSQSCN